MTEVQFPLIIVLMEIFLWLDHQATTFRVEYNAIKFNIEICLANLERLLCHQSSYFVFHSSIKLSLISMAKNYFQ